SRARGSRSLAAPGAWGTTGSARPGGDTCGPAARVRRSPTLRAGDSSEARSRLLVIDEIPAVGLLNGAFLQWLSFRGHVSPLRLDSGPPVALRPAMCRARRPSARAGARARSR